MLDYKSEKRRKEHTKSDLFSGRNTCLLREKKRPARTVFGHEPGTVFAWLGVVLVCSLISGACLVGFLGHDGTRDSTRVGPLIGAAGMSATQYLIGMGAFGGFVITCIMMSVAADDIRWPVWVTYSERLEGLEKFIICVVSLVPVGLLAGLFWWLFV
ncbi:unnamed protein product [marine sediment metagenome]|uniref:Uncharacterized protein n=1 Tax=marine sediment metagenome TaxID=412755 RepID=X0UY92_9ZZZZ